MTSRTFPRICLAASGAWLLTACGGGGSSIDTPPPDYTVGGTVSGLTGTVVLGNEGGDVLTIDQNGAFTFADTLPDGATYIVTVLSQPGGQTCVVSGGSGEISGGDVTGVVIDCAANAVIVPEGALADCFNPGLLQSGTVYVASYRVRRHIIEDGASGFYDVTFGITETREILGAASFNGEDNALQVRVSSVGEDIGVPPGGVIPLTDETEDFTGAFMAYYGVDPAGELRYLGAEREVGGVPEPWELAAPHEVLDFTLQPGESVEQTFDLTTEGVTREKETTWTFEGQGTVEVPAGAIAVCRVSGVGHEPSLLAPTVPGSAFVIDFARDTGIAVRIQYQDDTDFDFDPVMDMRLIEASIDGVPVHGAGS